MRSLLIGVIGLALGFSAGLGARTTRAEVIPVPVVTGSQPESDQHAITDVPMIALAKCLDAGLQDQLDRIEALVIAIRDSRSDTREFSIETTSPLLLRARMHCVHASPTFDAAYLTCP